MNYDKRIIRNSDTLIFLLGFVYLSCLPLLYIMKSRKAAPGLEVRLFNAMSCESVLKACPSRSLKMLSLYCTEMWFLTEQYEISYSKRRNIYIIRRRWSVYSFKVN